MPKKTAKMTAMDKKIRAARDNVRNYTFGTDEWEEAMVIVRQLCEEDRLAAPKFEYTSIDGDIFAP
jgi:hypothetical protein